MGMRRLRRGDVSSSRDLAVVASTPTRQASHATIGFLVTR